MRYRAGLATAAIASAVVSFFVPRTAAAVMDLSPGVQYEPGTTIRSAVDGVTFTLPDGWLGGMPPGSPAILLGSNAEPGVGILVLRSRSEEGDLAELLAGPQDLGEGVVLMPAGAPREDGGVVRNRFEGGMFVGHAAGRRGTAGNGLVVFFAGPAGAEDRFRALVDRMIAGAEISTPQADPESGRWQGLLAGHMLKRMSSYYSGGVDGAYVGGSSSETLHLCRDGSYAYAGSSQLGVDGGGGASGYSGGGDADRGRWRVERIGAQATLVLESSVTGETSYHGVLMNDEGHTIVDGERAYRVPSDRCP